MSEEAVAMERKRRLEAVGPGFPEGGRRPTGGEPGGAAPGGGGGDDAGARNSGGAEGKKRWTASRKRDAVLRLMAGESAASVSRDLGIEHYRLIEWRDRALDGMSEALKVRAGDPLTAELDEAKKRIGELSMENELLKKKCWEREASRRRGK